MTRRTTTGVFAAAALALGLTGCGAAPQSAPANAPTARLASTTTSPRTATTASAPKITKVLVFMLENHSLAEMKSGMPKVYAFAKRYAYASDYRGISHPSLPNYLAITGGSTFGVTDDANPSSHKIQGASVFSQALAHGKTAKLYADSMPSSCHLANAGNYAVRHNPWVYYVGQRSACGKYDVPFGRFAPDVKAGHLPDVGFVIPNLMHDAHNGTLAEADSWVGARLATIKNGSDWKSGHLAVVITADEDDDHSGNKVLTVVGSRYQSHRVVTTALNHYSLTRLIDDVLHVAHLRKAATAASMAKAFGVNVG